MLQKLPLKTVESVKDFDIEIGSQEDNQKQLVSIFFNFGRFTLYFRIEYLISGGNFRGETMVTSI